MKPKDLLLILLIGFIIYTLFRKEKVHTLYTFVGGLPDTTIIRDTISIPKSYKVTITKFDTIVIDSTGKIDYNAITSSWERFELKADTNIKCLGKVRLSRSMFEFDSVDITYPKILITQIDTIKLNTEVRPPFYKNEWFWATIITAGISILR